MKPPSSMLVAAALLSAGCGGRTTTSVSTGPGTTPGQGSGTTPSATGVTPKTSYSAAEVSAAQAQCGSAHGPVDAPATWGDLRAHLVGSWFLCSDGDDAGDAGPPSIFGSPMAFSRDGTWQRLLPDGNGGLVAGFGVTNQGSYWFYTGSGFDVHADTDPIGGGAYVTVTTSTGEQSSDSYFDGHLSFETSPRRMHSAQTWESFELDSWFVLLPP